MRPGHWLHRQQVRIPTRRKRGGPRRATEKQEIWALRAVVGAGTARSASLPSPWPCVAPRASSGLKFLAHMALTVGRPRRAEKRSAFRRRTVAGYVVGDVGRCERLARRWRKALRFSALRGRPGPTGRSTIAGRGWVNPVGEWSQGVVPAQRRRACRHAGLRGPTEATRIGRSRRPASHTRPALPRTPGCRIGPKGPAGLPRPGGQSAGQAARGAAGADAPASIVAVDPLHPLVALLRLDRQGGDRARLQPAQADRLAGLLAVAVGSRSRCGSAPGRSC